MPFPPSNDKSSDYGNDRDNYSRNFSGWQLFTWCAVCGTCCSWAYARTWGTRGRWVISGLSYGYIWSWISRTSSCRGRLAGLSPARSGWNERKYRLSRFSTSQGSICLQVSKAFGSRICDACWSIWGARKIAIVSPLGDLSLENFKDLPRQYWGVDIFTNLAFQIRA